MKTSNLFYWLSMAILLSGYVIMTNFKIDPICQFIIVIWAIIYGGTLAGSASYHARKL